MRHYKDDLTMTAAEQIREIREMGEKEKRREERREEKGREGKGREVKGRERN